MALLDRSASGFFSVFDDVLPRAACAAIYEEAVSETGKPWGVYVTLQEALDSDDDDCTPARLAAMPTDDARQKAMAKCAVKHLYLRRAGAIIAADWDKIHGVAVWSLSAGVGSQVEYHIDYAELYRYETNVIYPPLYAGTLQLTPVEDGQIVGGEFAANMRGLDHYREFGYKGRVKMAATGTTTAPPLEAKDTGYGQGSGGGGSQTADLLDTSSSAWMKVPYRCNRGIVHDGDLPHLSTKIEALPAHLRRVILGFNLFTHDVGPAAQRAPEHSEKFNATVKLYQTMAAVQGGEAKEKLTVADLKKNKGLYRMLKLVAKKMKDKDFDAEALRATPSTLESSSSSKAPQRVRVEAAAAAAATGSGGGS